MSTDRPGYIAGLRALADLLEQHDEVPLPFHGNRTEMLIILGASDDDHRQTLQAIARAFPGPARKDVRGEAFDLYVSVEGLRLQVIADRDQVCERVVKGTREVEVPAAPEQVIPAREATVEVVEDVEWVCTPLLADRHVDAEAVSA